jgi:hypothetical protein
VRAALATLACNASPPPRELAGLFLVQPPAAEGRDRLGVGLRMYQKKRYRGGPKIRKVPKQRHAPKKFAGKVFCECGRRAERVTGTQLYYGAKGPVARKRFYCCFSCSAWVGTHARTGAPLGPLATEPLRRARRRAHLAFDPIWKSGARTRTAAYSWLQCTLGEYARVHIGGSDIEMCERITAASLAYRAELRDSGVEC